MARRPAPYRFIPSLFLALVLAFSPGEVWARGGVDVPPLESFVEQVSNGEADDLRGVYVPGVLASPVLAQPDSSPAFVSSTENTLTQFEMASRHGSVGLLAHNYLAGRYFHLMEEGTVFYLIYGDGSARAFVVTRKQTLQALDPDNIRSDFIDLDSGRRLSASKLFEGTYAQPGRVVFQTCVSAHGNPSWGRLFIIAEHYTEE